MHEVTKILCAIQEGNPRAPEQLLPLVYDALRKLAAQKMAHEPAGQTLQPTALVHEVYLRLVGSEKGQHWNSRGHFFGAAAEAMRRILIESARYKHRIKRGGGQSRIELNDLLLIKPSSSVNLLALDEALTNLAAKAPAKAELVKLRYFAGLTLEQAAEAMDISLATAKRYWAYARAWLFDALNPSE